jgi:hypothetical protein
MVFWVTKEQLLAALSARALSSNVLQEYAVLKAENETLKSDNAALMTKLADQQPIIDIVTDATVVTAGTAAVAASGQ